MSKEELLDTVWGGHWVSESALTTRVKEIRRATGDTGDRQSVLRTVRGHGYQFVAVVSEADLSTPAQGHLVGRERDLAELGSRLRPGSLLTLVGPGGVGKTSLARTLVARAAPRFPDGVTVLDLTVLEQPSQLMGAVARAARVSEPSASGLIDALRRLDALLLLDDADDMVAAVAQLCDQLTADPASIAVVVTTRERLGVRGEQLWPVLPLSDSAARELLITRARELAPLGSLRDAGADQLDALNACVDRLPLAVEMLAGMSAVLDIEDLLRLVGHRTDLVTSMRRDAPERHRSLDRLVTSSVERLDDETRRALTALTSFAGAFTVTDAATVVERQDSGLALVRELIDRSLISPVDGPGGPRFQMLRTVHQAARNGADPDDLHAAALRHAQLVTAELERADAALRTEDELQAALTFERLADEARASHAWARRHDRSLAVRLTVALHLYAYSRMWNEPAQWAESIAGAERQQGAVLAALASQATQDGRLAESVELAERIKNDDDVQVRGWALEVLSDASIYLGRLSDAETHAQELVALGHRCAAPRMVAIGLTNAAIARTYAGRPEDGLELLDQPLPVPFRLAPSERAWLALGRGESLAATHGASAVAALREAARLGDSVGNSFVAGVARSTLASLETERGDLEAATATFIDILETFLRHGNVTHLSVFLRNVIPLLARLEEPAAAAVVGAWVFGPGIRPGIGPDVAAAHQTLDDLRAVHGDHKMDSWLREGVACTAAGATERALTAMRRYLGKSPTTS